MTKSSVESFRCAEVIADLVDGSSARGSGYLTGQNTVLTASHVVENAKKIVVRFSADTPDERTVEVREVLAPGMGQSVDIAVLLLDALDQGIVPAAFGRLGRRDGVVDTRAVGFPLFKLKTYGTAAGLGENATYRDSYAALGSIATLSNMREDTYEFQTRKSSGRACGDEDPWSGMSGAAVWVNGRIVGVVKSHSEAEGIGTLGVEPLSRLYQLPGNLVRKALNLPALLEDLADVSEGMSWASAISDANAAEAKALAPQVLLGRERELQDVITFLASQVSYGWWQGDPYAGKTAFAATIAFRPPVGVDVAFFFILRRFSAQSTQSAYLTSMTQQLNAIAGSETTPFSGIVAQRGLYEMALEAAASSSRSRGNKLLLIVDGLDEDQGIQVGSIASVLPANPPAGVKVLVTSRSQPGIPNDVLRGHPLRACVPRLLTEWPDKEETRRLATEELIDNYAKGEIQQKIIGLLTASGGGLSVSDMGAILGISNLLLKKVLDSSFARSFRTRLPAHSPQEGVHYLFGHDILREVAEDLLAAESDAFLALLQSWAGKYAEGGWNATTPEYLLTAFGTTLAQRGYSKEYFRLVTNSKRQKQTIARTGSNATTLEELNSLRRTLGNTSENTPFHQAMISESISRVSLPNLEPPPELPPALSRLGEYGAAEAWARQLKQPYVRAIALCQVSKEASIKYADWAYQLAHNAADLAPAVGVSMARERLLAAAAEALAAAQRSEEALEVSGQITDVATRYASVGAIAAHVRSRDLTRFSEILAEAYESLPSGPPTDVALAHAGLLQAWTAGDPATAVEKVNKVIQLAPTVIGREAEDTCIQAAAVACLALGEWPKAKELTDRLHGRLESALLHAQRLSHIEPSAVSSLMDVVSIGDGLPVSGRLSVLSQLYASSRNTSVSWLAPLLATVERSIRALPTSPIRARALADAAARMAVVDPGVASQMVSDCVNELRSNGASELTDRILRGLVRASIRLENLTLAERAIRECSTAKLRLDMVKLVSYSVAYKGCWQEVVDFAKSLSDLELKSASYTAICTSAADLDILPVLDMMLQRNDFFPSLDDIADLLLPRLLLTENWSAAMRLSALLASSKDRDLSYASISMEAARLGSAAWEAALSAVSDKKTRSILAIRIAARFKVSDEIAARAASHAEDVVASLSARKLEKPDLNRKANLERNYRETASEQGAMLQRIADVIIDVSPKPAHLNIILASFPLLQSFLKDVYGKGIPFATVHYGGRESNSSSGPAYILQPNFREYNLHRRAIVANYVDEKPGAWETNPDAFSAALSVHNWYDEIGALVSLGSDLGKILDNVIGK